MVMTAPDACTHAAASMSGSGLPGFGVKPQSLPLPGVRERLR